jgi:hypothetical protein
MPRPLAEFTLTMFAAAREGEFDVTGPTLEAVIGRPARTVEQVLAPPRRHPVNRRAPAS